MESRTNLKTFAHFSFIDNQKPNKKPSDQRALAKSQQGANWDFAQLSEICYSVWVNSSRISVYSTGMKHLTSPETDAREAFLQSGRSEIENLEPSKQCESRVSRLKRVKASKSTKETIEDNETMFEMSTNLGSEICGKRSRPAEKSNCSAVGSLLSSKRDFEAFKKNFIEERQTTKPQKSRKIPKSDETYLCKKAGALLGGTGPVGAKSEYFTNLSEEDLVRFVESTFGETPKFNDFNEKDSFISLIKKQFGIQLNDKNMQKQFNFLSLKIVWCQFMSNEKISASHIQSLSAFERVLLKTYLMRFGFIQKGRPFELTQSGLARLQRRSNVHIRSEKEMLAYALKQVFKRVMYPYFNKDGGKKFITDMRAINLSRVECLRLFGDLFGKILRKHEKLDDFLITEKTLMSSKSMIAYISRLARSERLVGIIESYLERQLKKNAENRHFGNIYLRHRYDIADKINKRINNYEIILNQFDAEKERKRIFQWMGIIIQDLMLNPKLKIPWTILELEDTIKLFQAYLNETKDSSRC